MSHTRFHDDPTRIQKQLQQSTFASRYYLNTPGAGEQLTFHEDPQMRLQSWGANLMNDSTNLESDLRGLGVSRHLSHNPTEYQSADNSRPTPMSFGTSQPFVEESRATHPAWMYRGHDHTRWETPLLDPQAYLEKTFQSNVQTRILEKDYWSGVSNHHASLNTSSHVVPTTNTKVPYSLY
jgi:hypothetical protein